MIVFFEPRSISLLYIRCVAQRLRSVRLATVRRLKKDIYYDAAIAENHEKIFFVSFFAGNKKNLFLQPQKGKHDPDNSVS
jgi:hypothetical protein